MKYENPQLPEGVNYSTDHPLKDFVSMIVVVTGLTAAAVAILFLLAGYLVTFIPFATEVSLADSMNVTRFEDDTRYSHTQHYLQQLTDQLATAEQLPDDMAVTVHYVDDDTVNAFATLGGHIFMHRGLLEKLPSENALAMVLAHEIAHIKHRDPIIAAGRGVTVMLAISCLFGAGDSDFSQQMIGHATTLTALAFSRDQEQAADRAAAQALLAHYGHLSGSAALFDILRQQHAFEPPAFLSSHPLTEKRLQYLNDLAASSNGKTTPLPPDLFAEE